MSELYEAEGYVFPLEVMSSRRAAGYRAMFESVEAVYEGDDLATRLLSGCDSIVLPFVDEIMRLPSVLEPVKAVLGDDLLVMGANFFVKEPATPSFVSWHQDLTYWAFEDASEVTAWVALTPAMRENGCMRFIPGSHRHEIVDQRVEVNEADAVDVLLQPGEMSLHHGHPFEAD
jgi:non-heme Fe2+,alpha-ketoglutarate-dependent halogenase